MNKIKKYCASTKLALLSKWRSLISHKNRRSSVAVIAGLLSIIVHLVFFAILFHHKFSDKDFTLVDNQNLSRKSIKISLTDEWQRQKILEYKQQQKHLQKQTESTKVAPPTPLKKDTISKQIVNNENTGKEETPLESRFLGEKNQTYEKQTIAKIVDTFKKAGVGDKISGELAANLANNTDANIEINTNANKNKDQSAVKNLQEAPVEKNKRHSLAASKHPSKSEQVVKKSFPSISKSLEGTFETEKIKLSDLKVSSNEDYENNLQRTSGGASAEKQIIPTIVDDEGNSMGILNGDPSLRGLASNNDFIEDVPLGDSTNLNTTEFKFFGFYSRIRERLEQHWGSTLKQKVQQIYKTGNKLTPGKNYITSLKISIDGTGNIIEIIVTGPSGFQSLDDAAIESFSKAGPFPNPPREMVKNGPAVLEWGFVVKS